MDPRLHSYNPERESGIPIDARDDYILHRITRRKSLTLTIEWDAYSENEDAHELQEATLRDAINKTVREVKGQMLDESRIVIWNKEHPTNRRSVTYSSTTTTARTTKHIVL